MVGESPRSIIQGLVLLALLAGVTACGRGDSGSGTQAGAAPDPFVGDYDYVEGDERITVFRVTREGERYFGAFRPQADGPFLPPVAAVDCPDYVHEHLATMPHVDPIVICIPSPMPSDDGVFALLHTRATTVVPEFDMRTTGYWFELIDGEVERTGPVAEEYARFLAAERAAATQMERPGVAAQGRREAARPGQMVTGNFGGPDCYWERMEFRRDGAIRVARQGQVVEGWFQIDGNTVYITFGGTMFQFRPLANGTLEGLHPSGDCVPVR